MVCKEHVLVPATSCAVAWFAFLMMATSCMSAEIPAPRGGDLDNIGFVKDVPAVLRERFPMCDAFLRVQWIDKEKLIGHAHYEAIMKSKKSDFKGEKKTVWALVNMKGPPGIDYDAYEYQRRGRLDELFKRVREGEVTIGIPMMIRYKGKTDLLYQGEATNDGADRPLLSDHRQTVCVPYPDEQLAWIVEGKSVGQTYTKPQITELETRLERISGSPFPNDRLRSLWLVDVNRDGIDDLLYRGSFIYSAASQWYTWERTNDGMHFTFTFPPVGRACRAKSPLLCFLTTDGKSYFYLENCNLTEMTIGKK